MSPMYVVLKNLKESNKLTEAMKQKAILLNWITEQEAQTL